MKPEEIIIEQGVFTLSEIEWQEAKRRADVIAPLAKKITIGHLAVDAAAAELGLSRRKVYELVHLWRQSNGLLTNFARIRSSGGKGKTRLSSEHEDLINEVLEKFFFSRQRLSLSVIMREIRKCCLKKGIKPPVRNTVNRRIEKIDPKVVIKSRQGEDAIRTLQSAAGSTPEVLRPLELVQIDHTKIDLIVVDEISRLPIGRPYLTIAIDVFSRCVVGMIVTLEAPSATSVGLCLSHIVTDKRAWIERLGIEAEWPMQGKPLAIHLDNAAEFKSDALRRGCEQHGIELHYRPLGQPHFGGIVERIIGTTMKMIHELPGTTFSNSKERGDYDSEKTATLTLVELERWLALAICGPYHGTVHSTLMEPPSSRWAHATTQFGQPLTVTNANAFLIDFLPVIKRTIQRIGFVIDRISYYANVLKPWIARRKCLDSFIIRRDPRNLSRVWVLDPETNHYLEIPYRILSNPSVTLWEHKKALEQLRKQGRRQIDEATIFRTIEQMRTIVTVASKETKKARRDNARRSHLKGIPRPTLILPSSSNLNNSIVPAKPFDEIEEW